MLGLDGPEFIAFVKEFFNADNAEWFPHDNDVVDAAWIEFLNTQSNASAINAIRVILDAGLSLPTDLNPFVMDALDAWSEARGTKQKVSARQTQDSWVNLVGDVHILRMQGKTRDAALQSVAKRNHKDVKTLRRNYNSIEHEETKRTVFIHLSCEVIKMKNNHEQLDAFVAEYPNFLKELHERNSM